VRRLALAVGVSCVFLSGACGGGDGDEGDGVAAGSDKTSDHAGSYTFAR
jgi:hypothetical protein